TRWVRPTTIVERAATSYRGSTVGRERYSGVGYTYDSYNNVSQEVRVSITGERLDTTTTHYAPTDIGAWIVDVPKTKTVKSTPRRGGGAATTRVTSYEPFWGTNLIHTETVIPSETPDQPIVTTYDRDPSGNGQVTRQVVTATATAGETSVAPGTQLRRE